MWDVSTLCAVVPPAGLNGVVGTGLLWDVSTLCALAPPAGLYGVVGTGVLWDVSTSSRTHGVVFFFLLRQALMRPLAFVTCEL
jgi:hypothetical protein